MPANVATTLAFRTILGRWLRSLPSFPGSAWERTVLEALPPASTYRHGRDPAIPWVPRQNLVGQRHFCAGVQALAAFGEFDMQMRLKAVLQ